MEELSDKEKAAIAKHYNSIVNKSVPVYVITKVERVWDTAETTVCAVTFSEKEAEKYIDIQEQSTYFYYEYEEFTPWNSSD